MSTKLFVDTDVIISSLISSRGASFHLLNNIDIAELFVSTLSAKEAKDVVSRLSLSEEKLEQLIQKRFTTVSLTQEIAKMKNEYNEYVLDSNDAHIVAGSREAKAQFLISYNIKDFKADKLKEDFGIILTTPANILQYLRSV